MGTTTDLQAYYQNLLILQYATQSKAKATVNAVVLPAIMPQTGVFIFVVMAGALNGGSWTLSLNGVSTSAINWNDSLSTIQTKIQSLYAGATVTGGYTLGGFSVSGANVLTTPLPTVSANSLTTTFGVTPALAVSLNYFDPPLPLAVRDAFNLAPGSTTVAVGAQLDVIGKYVGVTRTGPGFFGRQVTLSDADFTTLITLATAVHRLDASLASIQSFFATWFPNEIHVYDYATMTMSFLIASSVGTQDLVQRYVMSGLLPRPLAVQASVIYTPSITTFFGCRTYASAAFNVTPFNTYSSYLTSRPWVSYANAVAVPPT